MSSFEKNIQDVFEGAEFQPSDGVWAGIEASLTAKKKKGIFFLWQTYGIAAGLAAVLSFGFLYNDGFFDNGEVLPVEELSEAKKTEKDSEVEPGTKGSNTNDPEQENESIKDPNENEETLRAALSDTWEESSSSKNGEDLLDPKTSREKDVLRLQATINSSDESRNEDGLTIITERLEEVNTLSQEKLNSPLEFVLTDLKPYRNSLAAEILMWNAKLEMSSMDVPGIASGFDLKPSFNAQRSLNGSLGNSVMNLSTSNSSSMNIAELKDPSNFAALNASVESGEDQALGAISAGFGLTFDLSRKLSMNVGLRYAEFRFGNSSNAYSVENGVSLPIHGPVGFDPTNVFFVGEYELENTIQTLFLQTTFNYLLASFGKFDVALKAGVGIDYFLSYKVKGDLNFLGTRKVNPSESNFLNRTNISGITGFGLNYRLNSQFGLSGDITYRKFITTNPGDTNSEASSVLGFGISLNYFLNRKEE